jgi:hypothetical protein
VRARIDGASEMRWSVHRKWEIREDDGVPPSFLLQLDVGGIQWSVQIHGQQVTDDRSSNGLPVFLHILLGNTEA